MAAGDPNIGVGVWNNRRLTESVVKAFVPLTNPLKRARKG